MKSDPTLIQGRLRMTEEDIVGGLRGMTPLLRVRWVYLAVVVAGAVYGLVSGGLMKHPGQFFPFLGVNGFILALLFFAPKSAARKTAQALRLEEGDVTVRFDDEAVTIHAPGSTTTTAYRAIPGWRESASAFLLYCGTNAANIVPKRAFEPDDVPRVRALLAANVKAAPAPGQKTLRRTLIVWVLLLAAFMVVWQLFENPQARQRRERPAPAERGSLRPIGRTRAWRRGRPCAGGATSPAPPPRPATIRRSRSPASADRTSRPRRW